MVRVENYEFIEKLCKDLGGSIYSTDHTFRCSKEGKDLFEAVDIMGELFINATPHELIFEDGTKIKGSEVLAKIVSAKPVEREVMKEGNITYVTTEFEPTREGEEIVAEAQARGVKIIGSIIAAEAFKFPVVSPISTEETRRKPPAERRIYKFKWNTFV